MRLVNLEQGSPEWNSWRREKATASAAAVIMSCTPRWMNVRTWPDLHLSMVGLGPIPSKWEQRAYDHGHRIEPIARRQLVPNMAPACSEMDADPRFSASLDGWDPFDNAWAEIKCPVSGMKSKLLKRAKEGAGGEIHDRVSPYVWWQLVHQAGVVDDRDATCHYGIWVNESPDGHHHEVIPSGVLLDQWPSLHARWLRFLDDEDESPGGSAWEAAAVRWAKAKQVHNRAKGRLDAAQVALLELGVGEGVGVRVAEHKRSGSVDWKRAATELYGGEDLDSWADTFRRDPTVVTSIREVKE